MMHRLIPENRYPGPLITANKGDTLEITLNNKLVGRFKS